MTPSTSVSIQKAMRQARSGTVSPSVGSRVLDVKTTSFGPVNPTSPNKKRKDSGYKDNGQVQAGSDPVAALLDSRDKKRKGAVKKCLSPTVEVAKESEYGSDEGSSEEDSSEEECEQRSPNIEDPALGKRKSFSGFDGRDLQSPGKRKSFSGFDGRETSRGGNKKKCLPASSEPRTGTSSQKQELSGAAAFDEGADKPGRSGKKGRTPVSERVSMAKTTRGATTTLASEPVSMARTKRRAATKSKV